jgi:hypothetical protein
VLEFARWKYWLVAVVLLVAAVVALPNVFGEDAALQVVRKDRADRVVLGARPVRYRSLCEGDNPDWTWYGLIAEEVAELDPRLVFWGRPTKRVLVQEASEAVLGEAGEVIEPAREAVYTSVKDTEAPLQPEGVQYDRLTVMLIDVVQRQQEALEALRARVQELEEHVAQG